MESSRFVKDQTFTSEFKKKLDVLDYKGIPYTLIVHMVGGQKHEITVSHYSDDVICGGKSVCGDHVPRVHDIIIRMGEISMIEVIRW